MIILTAAKRREKAKKIRKIIAPNNCRNSFSLHKRINSENTSLLKLFSPSIFFIIKYLVTIIYG